MDKFFVKDLSQGLTDLIGAEPANLAGVPSGVVGQSASEFAPLFIPDAHHVPLVKIADHVPNPDRRRLFVPVSSASRAPESTT